MIYATAKIKDKQAFRGTLSLVWLFLNIVVLLLDVSDGLYTQTVIELSAVMLIIVPFSFLVGSLVFKRIKEENFMRIAYALLLLSGFAMLV